MTDEEIAVALTEARKDIGSLKHRVEDLEELTHSINELAISVKELATQVSNNNSRMDSYERSLNLMGERIGELEKKPAKQWDTLINVVITALVSGVIGFFISSAL